MEAWFGLFRDMLNMMQDRCTVCMECIICSKINLDAPMELLDVMCHMESRFDLFEDSVSFRVR